MKAPNYFLFISSVILMISACATIKMKIIEDQEFTPKKDSANLIHSFYLVGGATNYNLNKTNSALAYLNHEIVNTKKNSKLIFLGDNFYLKGITSENFKEYELAKTRWFNLSGDPLDDITLNYNSDKNVWDEQVVIIKDQIREDVEESTLAKFQKAVNAETKEDIKIKLKGRRRNLQKITNKYFGYLNNFQVIKGTNKKDWIGIERFENSNNNLTIYGITGRKKVGIILQKTNKYNIPKSLWLDRISNDSYKINETKKVKFYDFKSKKSTFKTPNVYKKLTDDSATNSYNYKKNSNFKTSLSPTIAYNPDDGVKLGVKNTFLISSFERNPFVRKHILTAFFYFATNGFELNYDGEIAKIIKKWNLGFEGKYTSANFSQNFFGFGNSSVNLEADNLEKRDFNRVKIEQVIGGTYLKWKGELGAEFKLGVKYQNYNVNRTVGRFLETQYAVRNRIFKRQQFFNTEASYFYQHSDNPAFPTLGIQFLAKVGFTGNIKENRDFSYAKSSLSITHKLIPNGKLVLASKISGQFIFDDEFEFYQASTIGGNNGIRAYRNERFTGKNAFYHSSDIRWNLKSVKTNLLPTNVGLFGGFDYGMVWGTPNSLTAIPNTIYRPRTSYGGGIFINAAEMLVGNIGAFTGDDGVRITFTLGFNF